MAYSFAVVTQVGAYPSNHAIVDSDLWIDGQFRADRKSVCLTGQGEEGGDRSQQQERLMLWLSLRMPVFHVGEILILGPDGRELGYPGRKPDKWDVTIEEFQTVEEAIARAREVMNAS